MTLRVGVRFRRGVRGGEAGSKTGIRRQAAHHLVGVGIGWSKADEGGIDLPNAGQSQHDLASVLRVFL